MKEPWVYGLSGFCVGFVAIKISILWVGFYFGFVYMNLE